MTIKNLYRYTDGDRVIVTPTRKRKTDKIHGYRLIADEGMILVNGDYKTPCIDVLPDHKDDWQEIEDTEGAEG